jgi:hypothetical protein
MSTIFSMHEFLPLIPEIPTTFLPGSVVMLPSAVAAVPFQEWLGKFCGLSWWAGPSETLGIKNYQLGSNLGLYVSICTYIYMWIYIYICYYIYIHIYLFIFVFIYLCLNSHAAWRVGIVGESVWPPSHVSGPCMWLMLPIHFGVPHFRREQIFL